MDHQGRPIPRPIDPLPYPHCFVILPPDTVTKDRTLYPPLVIKTLLPDSMRGHTINAMPCGMDADDRVRPVLQGNFAHQGKIVDEYVPDAGGSSSSGGGGGDGSGYHTVYFVFSHLTFTSTGAYKIRLSLWDMEDYGYLGDIDTDFFDVIRRSARRQVPNHQEAATMEYLREAGFDDMPAST
ncbi:hypothetical protein QBC39DRAFT_328854 [Podospora conica]|nr:hypothetical protein QBC39DRAFT_328854 [Schizothecium conicum]